MQLNLRMFREMWNLRDVSFKYKEDYDYVLKNISLDIKAGEYVALVGASGVGKTTLCSLIPRFYEVNEGEILLDGKNISDITLALIEKEYRHCPARCLFVCRDSRRQYPLR